ncbi:MAG: UDP-3-O-(3-hydroxymyristoyl)glucosamine N-acyltransferase [Gemmatimonadaceae bacterium]|nr:UDP-3-O-(3-hydroxymyristoyl)glucosamine N-acyltransferase [Gemmatimonadaceae bacterium]
MRTSTSSGSNDLSGDGACTITAEAIAALVGGELIGDGSATVTAVAPLDRAEANDLSFIGNAKYSESFASSAAGVVLVDPEFRSALSKARARIIVEKPMEKMLAVLPKLYAQPRAEPGIAPTARIGKGASFGARVSIGDYAVIGDGAAVGDDCVIGSHCVVGAGAVIGARSNLYPHATLYPGVTLGERVTIHSGTRLGSDGFGYVFSGGAHAKIPHVGRCIIGDDVEIGANTTIDRGSIDDTVIGAGTKIDNLVQIAHNVRVGRLCLLVAQVGVAGSVVIEDGCVIGGQAGFAGHITIGAGAKIAGQSGVFGDVPPGETWSGYPARPHRESLRASGALFKLAGMMRRIEKLLEEHPEK